MNDKQLTEDLVEMSDLIEDYGLGAFREFNVNELHRYITQRVADARLNEALYIRYNAPDRLSEHNWIGDRITTLTQGIKE